jgi:uncharacterized protein involved in exopolysaccharide biosynthesis
MPYPNSTELSFNDYVGVLRRRAGMFGIIAATIILTGVAYAYRQAPIFESTGVLLAEEPEVPEYVVRSTVPNYPEERVRIITQRVLTSENLIEIIRRHSLYPELADSQGAALREFRSHLGLSADDPEILENIMGARQAEDAIAFSLTFGHSSPVVARDVADDLVALYLEENLQARRQQAAGTTAFLTREAQRLEAELAEREQRLADFKTAHTGNLPEAAALNVELLDRAERDLGAVESEIRTLREQRELYSRELAQLSPQAPVVNERGETILGAADRLQVLQREYARLTALYSQDHPDVRRLGREIEALSGSTGQPGLDGSLLRSELAAQREQLAEARERYSPDHPDVRRLERQVASLESRLAAAPPVARPDPGNVVPDNPVYIQRQVQLEATVSELEAALVRRDELRARTGELEGRLTASPEVEREFNELARGHEQLESQYNDVQRKLREAEIAQNLESETQGERFSVLDSPGIADRPASPNRIAILLLSLVIAPAVGAGSVAVAENVDGRVKSVRDISVHFDMPPIAAIPHIDNAADARRSLFRFVGTTAAIGLWAGAIVFLMMTPAG